MDCKRQIQDILFEIDTLQHKLTIKTLEDRKKEMYIQKSLFAIKTTLCELLKKLD